MRQKITIGMLIIFCSAEVSILLPYLEYFIHHEYISEILCVNKDKPMLSCNGKCYLNDQLLLVQENKSDKESLPIFELDRVPMLSCNMELPKLLVPIPDAQAQINPYQFLIKEWIIQPPIPPPKC